MGGASMTTATTDPLQAFEPTWVVYDPKDPLGAVLALCTLSPVFIMVMYATLVVFQRDMDAIALLVGQLLNEAFNQVLKRSIKQDRPQSAHMSGAGMPSAHSQFIAFFAVYVVAYTLKRFHYSPRRFEKVVTIVGALILAVVVCVSRVRLGYHTLHQVLVGAAVGVITGITWFFFISQVSPWLFPRLVASPTAQFFYLRDISAIPDLITHQHELSHPSLGLDSHAKST